DPHDRVRGLLDPRVRDLVDLELLLAVVDDRLHWASLAPIPVRISSLRSLPPALGSSGGVSLPAPSRNPASRSSSASPERCRGAQPSSRRRRETATGRAPSSRPSSWPSSTGSAATLKAP